MGEHVLAELAGTWTGRGDGEYPTVADFAWTEEFSVVPVPGKPVAHWTSRTRDAVTGEPRHAESGFLRAAEPGGPDSGLAVQLVVAHPFGVVEVATGTWEHGVLTLASTGVLAAPGAKQVDADSRRYEFDGDTLRYTLAMAAVGVPLTHHLRAELTRA